MREMQTLWYFTKVALAGSFHGRRGGPRAQYGRTEQEHRRPGAAHEPAAVYADRAQPASSRSRGALLENVGGAFGAIEDSYQKVRSVTAEPVGVVRLSTVTAYGKHCVLPLLPRFFRRYPHIELVMSFHDGSRGLTRQEFDIRINWGEDKEKTRCRRRSARCHSSWWRAQYLAQRGTPRTLEDLGARLRQCRPAERSPGGTGRLFRVTPAARSVPVIHSEGSADCHGRTRCRRGCG
jgi:hypothetical protein